jgi:5-methylcytosine-specific restriction endonuclease McrA
MKSLNLERLRKSKTLGARRKLAILKRDNYECRNCGDCRELTIAHIKKKKGGRNGADYKYNECIVLCKRCHSNLDYSYKKLPNRLLYCLNKRWDDDKT